MNKQQERDFYKQEVIDAQNVSRLKNKYLDKFFIDKAKQIYDFIAELPLGSDQELSTAHHQLKSINALKIEMQTYLDSGKMAAISLDEHNT